MHVFRKTLPDVPPVEQLKENNKQFSVADVKHWVAESGAITGRFQFFETYAASNKFYQKIAKPLLSMRTVGSIDVERRVKPIKHTILTKRRNRLQDPKRVTLFRASENLKHIMKAKIPLGKKVTDSL